MFGKPKYIFVLLAFFFVEGAAYEFNKRLASVASEGNAAEVARTADHMFWFNDAIGRLFGGVLAYLLVSKINTYFFLMIYSFISAIGHIILFMVISLNIDGSVLVMSATFFISLGAGAFWVLVAEIIIDDGGIRNFGLNWGCAVFFNLLGIFFFDFLAFFISFKVAMGYAYLITGFLIPLFVILAWSFDNRDNRHGSA